MNATLLSPAAPWGTSSSTTSGVRAPGERLALGIVAAAVVLLPFLVPTGPLNVSPVDLVIGLGIGATLLWAGSHHEVLRAPYALGVALMIAGGSIAALTGSLPTAGLGALLQDLMLFTWVLAIVNLARRPANLDVLLRAWCYGSVAWAVVLFVGLAFGLSFLDGVTAREGSRVSLLLGDPNFAGNYFFISIMLVWATKCPRTRTVRWLAYLGLLLALALTGSNSAVASLTVGGLIIAFVNVRRRAGLVQAIGMLTAGVVVVLVLFTTVPLSSIEQAAQRSKYAVIRDGIGRGASSVSQRDLLLHESIRLFYSGTLLGSGPVSTKTRLIDSQALFVKEAHSDYWAALVERGVIGFLGLLVLVGAVLQRGWRVLTRPLSPGYAVVVPRPEALAAAVVGCLIAASVVEVLHVRHVWFVFAVVAAASIWGVADA